MEKKDTLKLNTLSRKWKLFIFFSMLVLIAVAVITLSTFIVAATSESGAVEITVNDHGEMSWEIILISIAIPCSIVSAIKVCIFCLSNLFLSRSPVIPAKGDRSRFLGGPASEHLAGIG
jgi:heme/copper-type cytochrome/quinol oxidase subunit 2